LAKLGHLYVVLARQSGTTGEDPDIVKQYGDTAASYHYTESARG